MHSPDVIIAGAGIIGLSAALELASQGLRVTVLEQGSAMREASWAAAGMLAAGDPENPPALGPLANLSRDLYPGFLAQVEKLSGESVPLRTTFTLQGLHPSAVSQHALDDNALRAAVPELTPGAYRFLRLDEHSLDPRDLCRALPLAARAAGVALYEYTPVEQVAPTDDQLRITTNQGAYTAQHYVHCCGAWSGPWSGIESLAFPIFPIEPRKGQILAVTMPAGTPTLACVLRTPEIYLVPRGDGCIVIGATVEHAGFDRTITNQATEALLATAAALWPPIRAGVVTERWIGLRPSTPDALPILGAIHTKLPGASSLWIAAGHFRNGILLAPGTAHVLAQIILGQQPTIPLEPFSAGRFATVETAS